MVREALTNGIGGEVPTNEAVAVLLRGVLEDDPRGAQG